jgi:hypothetical protein
MPVAMLTMMTMDRGVTTVCNSACHVSLITAVGGINSFVCFLTTAIQLLDMRAWQLIKVINFNSPKHLQLTIEFASSTVREVQRDVLQQGTTQAYVTNKHINT